MIAGPWERSSGFKIDLAHILCIDRHTRGLAKVSSTHILLKTREEPSLFFTNTSSLNTDNAREAVHKFAARSVAITCPC